LIADLQPARAEAAVLPDAAESEVTRKSSGSALRTT
jgi:hypothetical protein